MIKINYNRGLKLISSCSIVCIRIYIAPTLRFHSHILSEDAGYPPLMHEVSVVTSLVDAVIAELGKYKVEKVNSVTAVIGDLTNLGEEQMAFAYEIVTRGTILEGSEFIVEHEPIELRCDSCGYWGPAKILTDPDFDTHSIPVLACPECGGHVQVTKGQSCTIRCMDIEEAD